MLSKGLIGTVVLLCSAWLYAGTVTLTPATTYQTIEGIGFFDNISPWKVRSGPFYVDVDLDAIHFWDTLAHGLGASMIRFELPPGFTASNGTRTMGASDGMALTGRGQVAHALKFQQAGVNRFIYTVWSPPGFMKASGTANGYGEGTAQQDNYLLPASYSAFADHLVAFVDSFTVGAGLQPYGLSPQNESAFSEPYNSCVYTPNQLRDLVKVIGPKWSTRGFSTRIYYAEHMGWAFGTFEGPVRSDPAALAAVDRWAYHGYTDGVTPDPGSFDSSNSSEKAVWMTETCCYASTIEQAQNIHNTLGPGRGSAYMYWAFTEICVDGVPNFRYHALKQYARYIRPGARQIASSATGGLQACAFTHAADNTMTIVIINSGASQSLNLAGSGIPATLGIYQCTNSTPSVQVGSMASNGTITLPAASVTTLYNMPATSVREQARRASLQHAP
jgi:glucuronoarabinoxylan endo-1,4-beta-xylanase